MMKRIFAELSLCLLIYIVYPVISAAEPMNDQRLAQPGTIVVNGSEVGRLRYDEGTRLEFGDTFDLKMNFLVQPRITFSENDEHLDKESKASGNDTTSVSVKRIRLEFTGNLFNREFSYKLQEDLAGGIQGDGRKGSNLKDAWLQWNLNKAAKVRVGQHKVPFSRQELVSVQNLQFLDRSLVTQEFVPARNVGAMLQGSPDHGMTYSLGVYNGESKGEGENREGTDNKVLGAAMLSYDIGEYGERNTEGDWAYSNAPAATMGLGVLYGQGKNGFVGPQLKEFTLQPLTEDFDKLDVNIDFAVRCHGSSFQGEFFYRHLKGTSPTSQMLPAGENFRADDLGFYFQSGWFFVPRKWEIAGRFGYLAPDSSSGIDDVAEYSGVVSYYIRGRFLKLQAGVTAGHVNIVESKGQEGISDGTDVKYLAQLSGYF